MTINKVLERVRAVKPDALDEETKAGWLLDLEGVLHKEVILPHWPDDPEGPEAPEGPKVRRWPEDGDEELLVGAPYDRLYELYLACQIDLYYQDDGYGQSATLYNDALTSWRTWYNRTHMPNSCGGVKNLF